MTDSKDCTTTGSALKTYPFGELKGTKVDSILLPFSKEDGMIPGVYEPYKPRKVDYGHPLPKTKEEAIKMWAEMKTSQTKYPTGYVLAVASLAGYY